MDETDDVELEAKRWMTAEVENALDAATPNVMPPMAVALYARWWQLETWLRELAYVELRALYGRAWLEAVKAASQRQAKDLTFTHMTGTDNANPLAYLDYSQLVDVMGRHWEQFGYALVERQVWDGRQHELRAIRHRIGHLRKPHPDDVGRLEQTLRDLELGAFIALASYNRRFRPNPDQYDDPVTKAWIREEHPVARRLLVHADVRYETNLVVKASRRPWAKRPDDLSKAAGILWHAEFFMRTRMIDVRRMWQSNAVISVRPLIVHMLSEDPHHIGFTFSAIDDSLEVSDAIGEVFEAVLSGARVRHDEDDSRWRSSARDVDYRVQAETGWTIVNEDTVPITNFGSGGGIHSVPAW